MRNKIGILSVGVIIYMFVLQSCNPPWDDHYSNSEDHINMEIWEAISNEPRFSTFVAQMQTSGLDTIFQDGLVYTLFVPNNDAFESLTDTTYLMQSILRYHISKTLFIDRNVQNWRRLLTNLEKYALIEAFDNGYTYDGIPIEYGSPLYLNGKYYEISSVAIPKPSLYEYTAQNCLVLKEYIDSKDSIFLDRSLSTPIGFDEEGNTIYDSVFTVVNTFAEKFFPVNEEFRDKSATFIIFSQEQYISALDDMAGRLGGNFIDHNDIPKKWQDDVFLPDFTSQAMFPNILSYSDLELGNIQSITGDSVELEAQFIDQESRSICSNGVAFLYSEFLIKDELFRGNLAIEGEHMIDSIGAGKFAWKEGYNLSGAIIPPEKGFSSVASNGALVNVTFDRNYKGNYSLEFTLANLFPMRYRLEWRANSRPSGVFEVYVNDKILTWENKFGTQTTFDTYDLRNSIISVTGERFLAEDGYNIRDYWIENLTDFGDVTIRFEYVGPGGSSNNGFNIDYIKLIPG